MKIIVTIIPTNRGANLLLFLFLFFRKTKKEDPIFQLFASLVTRSISVFCLQGVAFCFKTMQNLVKLHRGTFLHAIPVGTTQQTFVLMKKS